ncbi:MAG: GAF domain-containing protein [Pleurocapsa minor GSE-CHR-MK-17-07R]|jgi:PAS domain S-box-containing protein|nr:GAF domain-containing protein [Pleurocapsa minor GSE-CHR-MK 17-07R]
MSQPSQHSQRVSYTTASQTLAAAFRIPVLIITVGVGLACGLLALAASNGLAAAFAACFTACAAVGIVVFARHDLSMRASGADEHILTSLIANLERLNQSPRQDDCYREAGHTAYALTQAAGVVCYSVEQTSLVFLPDAAFGDIIPSLWQAPHSVDILTDIVAFDVHKPSENRTSLTQALSTLAKTAGFGHGIIVPLRSVGLLQGIIVVLFRPGQPKPTSVALNGLRLLTSQVASILDNTNMFSVLETYAINMIQLSQIMRLTTLTSQIEQLAEEMLISLRSIMRNTSLSLGLLTPDMAFLDIYEQNPETEMVTSRMVALEKLPILQSFIASDRKTYALYPCTPEIDAQFESFPGYARTTSVSIFPLMALEGLVGFLIGCIHSDISAVMDNDVQLLDLASGQIATQIQNVRLFNETQQSLTQRLDELNLIEEISRQMATSLQTDSINNQLLNAALRATEGDIARIILLGDEGGAWTVLEVDRDDALHRFSVQQDAPGTLIRQVIETRDSCLVSSLKDNAFSYDAPEGMESLVAVPLESDSRVEGVLVVHSARTNFFSLEHLGFLNSLAGHAVITLENARLIESSEYQIHTLGHLQDLTLRLTNAPNLLGAAEAVAETACNILRTDAASIFRYNSASEQIMPLVTFPRGSKRRSQEMMVLPEVAISAAKSGDIRVQEHQPDVGFLVAVPLLGGYGVQQVLCISFPAGRTLKQREMDSLKLLAGQAVGHLENAALVEQIRAGSNRMRAILNSTRDGVLLLDRDGVLLECNPAAERLLGFEKDDFIGQHLVAMLMRLFKENEPTGMGYNREELKTLARQLRLEPERITRREFSQQNGGQVVYLEEIGSPVRSDRGDVIGRLLVLRDATEQRLVAEYRDEITRMMVHDLRGPLWSIQTGISLARSDIDTAPESGPYDFSLVQKTLEISDQSARDLMRIVDSLLDIARLERRELPLKRIPVGLTTLVTAATASLDSTIKEARLDVVVQIPPELPGIYVDEDIMRRVLVNLLDNAVRHSPEGSQVLVSAEPHGAEIKILIADSGRGIPLAERERIFERFRQVKENVPVRGSKGSGLGLTFCKLAVEAHGGHIRVEPQSPLSGACFSITLPIA